MECDITIENLEVGLNKIFNIVFCAIAVLTANISFAATPDTVENWDNGTVQTWKGMDELAKISISLSNPSNYLTVSFAKQTRTIPEVKMMYADQSSSGGSFIGNYSTAGVLCVHFKIYCAEYTPPQVRLYICNETTGHRWYYPITGLHTGRWVECHVPLNYQSGWMLGTDQSEQNFLADIASVSWAGIRFQRDASIAPQVYGLDDFELSTSAPYSHYESGIDSDGDGMTDYQEYIAGSDAYNPDSKFTLEIGRKTETSPGIMLRWNSISNRWYDIWRTWNLMNEFSMLESNIVATPPVNEYEDITATNQGSYFYKVNAKDSP